MSDESSNRLDAIESDLHSVKSDVTTLKSDVTRLKADVGVLKADVNTLRGDVADIRRTLATMAEGVAEIKGAMPHMATEAQVEKASHNATRGLYTAVAAWAAIVVAAVIRFWPTSTGAGQ